MGWTKQSILLSNGTAAPKDKYDLVQSLACCYDGLGERLTAASQRICAGYPAEVCFSMVPQCCVKAFCNIHSTGKGDGMLSCIGRLEVAGTVSALVQFCHLNPPFFIFFFKHH